MKSVEKTTTFLSRIALFIVFFWFGFIKLFGLSPANELVETLLTTTLPFIPFSGFIIFLGLTEILIGILFLIPRIEKTAIVLLGVHMFTTFLPLVFLPGIAWAGILIPTLEGQYIIKNLVILALAANIFIDAIKNTR